MWNEALDQAGVDASSTLRRAENAFYPLALRIATPSSSHAKVDPKAPELSQAASTSTLSTSTIPPKEADQTSAVEKDKELTKPPYAPKDPSKEKGAS